MIDKLKELEALARKWSKVTGEDGTGHKTYEDEAVTVYHSDNYDHSAVKFGIWPWQITVVLYEPVRFEANINALKDIDAIITSAKTGLDNICINRKKQSKGERKKTMKEQAANARLIAAAPELLEACIMALDVLKGHELAEYGTRPFIEAAIKKAKRES